VGLKLNGTQQLLAYADNQNNQVEEDEMGRACGKNGAKRNVYRILVGKPDGKRPLGRQRQRVKMDLREIRWDGMDWTDMAQDRY
jgi:hypothetical protein